MGVRIGVMRTPALAGRWPLPRVLVVSLVGALLIAATAGAAPSVTMQPSGETVAHMPMFTVTSTPPATTVAWTLTGPGGYLQESDFPEPTTPATTPTFPVGLDGLYTFTATETPSTTPAVVTFTLDTTPPPVPQVQSGPPAVVGASAVLSFTWTGGGDAAGAQWRLLDLGAVIGEGTVTQSTVTVPMPALTPGDRILRFQVRSFDPVGNPSPFSTAFVFNVDQTPAAAPFALSGPTGTIRDLTPTFSWQATELGGTFRWDVVDVFGARVYDAAVTRVTPDTSLTVPALPLGASLIHSLRFTVRHTDVFGNSSAESNWAFTVTTVPIRAPQPTRFADRMQPQAGAVVTRLRPLLRWQRRTKGVTSYNVKVYLGDSRKTVHITSATRPVASFFPTANTALVPKGRLKPGRRYVWYVWEWIGKKKRYAPLPMISWFEVAGPGVTAQAPPPMAR